MQYNLDCRAIEVKTSQEIYNNFELLQGQCHASPPEYGLIRSETPSFGKVKELFPYYKENLMPLISTSKNTWMYYKY